jgi:hypothetical protein
MFSSRQAGQGRVTVRLDIDINKFLTAHSMFCKGQYPRILSLNHIICRQTNPRYVSKVCPNSHMDNNFHAFFKTIKIPDLPATDEQGQSLHLPPHASASSDLRQGGKA